MGRMWRLALLPLVAALACGGGTSSEDTTARPRTPGLRITMDALHRMGGTPPGWKLTPPAGSVAAGRRAFVDFGCASCHKVEGESFSVKESAGNVGPDLTGMGAHHPAAYFAEAILNPDAVLIEGPGYIGPDGHSVMPDYPDMTSRQLGDLVAYVSSLTKGGPHAGHIMPPPERVAPPERPVPASQDAKAFFYQTYDVKPGQLAAFEAWWKSDGAKLFLGYPGLVSVDTYVDFTRQERFYTSVFAFRDEAALGRFMQDPASEPMGLAFDAYIGDHGHDMVSWMPIFRVPSLSAP
jgi:mono/diheme cytochrome c family protein